MTIFGNLSGTFKNLFRIGKNNKILLGNDSGDFTIDVNESEAFRIATNGTLNTSITDYEDLVTTDDIIPNKKFVSDITDTLKDIQNYADSPGIISGGAISEGTNVGTFKVAALTAFLRSTDSATGDLVEVSLSEQDNQVITAADTHYIITLNYNGGSPTISLNTSNPYDADKRNIPIGQVTKTSGNTVHYISGGYDFQDGVKKLHERAKILRKLELATGSTIAYSGTNNFTMTAGIVFGGLNKFTVSLYDSATTTFTPIYGDGSTGFTEGTERNIIDYTKYDDGSGTLANINNNKYGCHWVYRHIDDGHVFVVYGYCNDLLSVAESTGAPAIPDYLTNFGVLVGKIIAPQAGGSFATIQMATDTFFSGTTVSDHNGLSSLQGGTVDEYYHLTASEYTNVRYVPDTIAALRLISLSTNGVIARVKGRSVIGDNGGGLFYWNTGNLSTEVTADTQSGLYVAPNSDLTGASGAWVRIWGDVGDCRWFGMTDTGDQVIPLQAAITAICGVSKSLYIFPGDHQITASVTFPNTGFRVFGDSATHTAISEVPGSGQITLFDLTGLTGPSSTIEKISLNGPIGGGLGGIGCYVNISNGTVLRHCWFRGLTNAIHKTANASLLTVSECVFEFNFGALVMSDGVQCIVNNNVFYQNSYDYYFDGDFSAGVINGATFIETKIACCYMDGVIDGTFTDMSCRQDFDQQLPTIFDIRGGSKRNQIDNLRTKSFGATFIKFSAEANTDNTFTNISAILIPHIPPAQPPPTGTLVAAIQLGIGSDNNTFNGFKTLGVGYGIVDSGDNNQFNNGVIDGSTIAGAFLASSDNTSFTNVEFVSNLADWATTGTINTIWLDRCVTNYSGFVATRFGTKGAGIYGRVFYASTLPTSLSYITNDFVVNVAKTVDGNSMILKGWHRATTGSNHVINVDWWPIYESVVSPAV